MNFLLPILLCSLNWSQVIEETEHMTPIAKGASNHNYCLQVGSDSYFIRKAPKQQALYADLAIEAEVLQLLGPLDVSAQLLHYDAGANALALTFIEHEGAEIDLLDRSTRKEVMKLLHKIEESSCAIERIFEPYNDIVKLIEKSPQGLPEEVASYLPLLQKIDRQLAENPRKVLCHLDLHHKNILKDQERFWIIDWEYAVMSHPFLVLASMASIERWSDVQMQELLEDYMEAPTEADFVHLYLYRIVADLFWTVWNHVQMHTSSLDAPYEEWRNLFYAAAKERMQKLSSPEVILLFGPPGSGKGTFSQIAIQKGYGHISAGDLLRDEVQRQTDIGRLIEKNVREGSLVPPELTLGLIQTKAASYLAKRQSFVIDGYGRSSADAANLQALIQEMRIPCRVVFLEADDEICKKRIMTRLVCNRCHNVVGQGYAEGDKCPACCEAPLELRLNDTSDIIDRRLKQYHEETTSHYGTFRELFPSMNFRTDGDLVDCAVMYEQMFKTCTQP